MSPGKRIIRLLRKAVAEGTFPGAVLLVARNKEILFFEAVGQAALLPTPRPMRTEIRFDLASLTKPLATTLAVLTLVSQERLRLDATLGELLPGGVVPADKEAITLRQLLCHCSGLPSWKPFYLYLQDVPRKSRRQRLRRQLLRQALESSPDRRTKYSDLGFMVVEWIVEEASGESFHHFTRQHLFQPLGCSSLGFMPLAQSSDNDSARFAATEYCPWRGRILCGEVDDENAYILGGVAGHAGLFGTALDVKAVLDAIVDTLASRSCPLAWSARQLARFLQPARLDPSSTWALGFDTPAASGSSAGHHFSAESVGHLGFTGTSFWLDLRRQLAVIFLSNRIHPSRANDRITRFRPLLHDAVMEEFG